jgi:hypothetical protein
VSHKLARCLAGIRPCVGRRARLQFTRSRVSRAAIRIVVR